MIFVDKSLNSP
jgi:hypothetical protein